MTFLHILDNIILLVSIICNHKIISLVAISKSCKEIDRNCSGSYCRKRHKESQPSVVFFLLGVNFLDVKRPSLVATHTIGNQHGCSQKRLFYTKKTRFHRIPGSKIQSSQHHPLVELPHLGAAFLYSFFTRAHRQGCSTTRQCLF